MVFGYRACAGGDYGAALSAFHGVAFLAFPFWESQNVATPETLEK